MSEGCVDGSDELTAYIGGIDALTLKSDIYAKLFQFPNTLEALFGIPGEAGDGLNEDLIDETPAAICHHALEVIPFFRRCTSDALVGIDVHHSPLRLL